ncbi:MAG TPA: hypothetical protein VL401_04120 [Alphaproteobacteria bacterium]|jgi:hypothetical protein|nr:hypothetical protein [Alphaproteobacteria bacterium]
MSEQNESLIDTLSKVNSLNDLAAGIPKHLIDSLGGEEKGTNRALAIIIGLAPFAPEPATFAKDAFDFVVGFDEETGEKLPSEEVQKMFDVALEAGFMKESGEFRGEKRYASHPKITPLVEKLFQE